MRTPEEIERIIFEFKAQRICAELDLPTLDQYRMEAPGPGNLAVSIADIHPGYVGQKDWVIEVSPKTLRRWRRVLAEMDNVEEEIEEARTLGRLKPQSGTKLV